MTTRRIDPDFEERRSKAPRARGRRFLGAAPVLVALLAGVNGFGYLQAPPNFRRPPFRPTAPRMWTPPPALPPPALPPMVVPAPAGIDEAMIHRARPDLDPRMVVPAFRAMEGGPAPMPYTPLWNVPIPPAPGLTEPGGTTPRR
ncbi:MAG: hypothetical protein BGO49_08065 [Planctomycetales bacterium 71-10]|nr:MAG: hypothetical protein BGO49_08065 [Planctomycetales bacterium 71-10]